MSQQQQASSDLVASLQEQLVLGKKENAQKIKKSSEAVKAKHQSKIESMQAEIDRLREASSMPRTAVIINANINSDALQALANKHYFAKDYQQAADCFQKLIDMGVNSISVYKHYGNALNKLRRPSEAAQVFDKALAIDSNDPFSLKGKGFALMHAGDKQSALAIFSSVLANDPSDQLAIDQVQRLSQTARPQLGYASNSSGRSSLFFAPASSGHPRPRNRHHASQGDSIRPSQLYAKR
jgi:tetratricopeptide (TPR) repeat protein